VLLFDYREIAEDAAFSTRGRALRELCGVCDLALDEEKLICDSSPFDDIRRYSTIFDDTRRERTDIAIRI